MNGRDVLCFVLVFLVVCGGDYLLDSMVLDGPVNIDWTFATIIGAMCAIITAIREKNDG